MAQAFIAAGSGFIGRSLAKRLLTERHTIKVLVRGAAPADVGTAPVRGELTDPDTRRAGVEGPGRERRAPYPSSFWR